jgi:hypothetical protein
MMVQKAADSPEPSGTILERLEGRTVNSVPVGAPSGVYRRGKAIHLITNDRGAAMKSPRRLIFGVIGLFLNLASSTLSAGL